MEKDISLLKKKVGGGGVDNGNVYWCMLGRAFCVGPGIFVPNRAFFASNEYYNDKLNMHTNVCLNMPYLVPDTMEGVWSLVLLACGLLAVAQAKR